MRVPLEIFRIILDYVTGIYTRLELLSLRHINSRFNEEILVYLFSERSRFEGEKLIRGNMFHRRMKRGKLFAFGAVFDDAPLSLQERYVYYRATRHHTEPSLFTCLFIPVYERQLMKLGVAEWDRATRDAKLREWCLLPMHQDWNIGWVVAHRVSTLENKILRYTANCGFANGIYDNWNDEHTVEARRQKRIENDCTFLEICCAILHNDEDAVLEAFPGSYIFADDMNICFGTTLLGFAIKRGTPSMLKLLLRPVHSTEQRRLYVYLQLALSRSESADAIFNILLDNFSGFDTAKKAFTQNLLHKAMNKKNFLMFDALIRWMVSVPAFSRHHKRWILEVCFLQLFSNNQEVSLERVLPRRPRNRWRFHENQQEMERWLSESKPRDFLTYPVPGLRLQQTATLNILPAYQLGAYYRNRRTESRLKYYDGRGFMFVETYPNIPTCLFLAVSLGLTYWVDWLLWAGANPRHQKGEESILEVAFRPGIHQTQTREGGHKLETDRIKVRARVAELLQHHGWDARNLEVDLGTIPKPKPARAQPSVYDYDYYYSYYYDLRLEQSIDLEQCRMLQPLL
ncbi:hypothetical protein P153DRAFT_380832 [Dothidotthia symphoricarpi CBS 119687]|uniref:Uncharacterized protein n=1 Tax=Dothidotthia symphoricarpi CBS 119687 TaxID=1392245 RepID=A0A6A6ASP0_9PLEO|nr:uncharacterized protein P153DRAFT_380832 [Dothidotthia symphoricarpi CBS 119687]KAF2135032.1 hypothetical protein P153DRAFT_380832 [Dothidotthia symphoricarpi CBS 119687]